MAQPGPATARAEQKTVTSQSFLLSHPDIRHRLDGWVAYENGLFEEAKAHFTQSALYADKLSQAMLAEMHWQGKGVQTHRPLAYAWADLAAERGYPRLVALRERYWEALDAAERAQSLELGQALYHTYGDDVAKPRMARQLRNARRAMIGNRPRRDTWVVVQDHAGRWIEIQGHHFYDQKFWHPEHYQEWVDETWASPQGKVDVGKPVTVP